MNMLETLSSTEEVQSEGLVLLGDSHLQLPGTYSFAIPRNHAKYKNIIGCQFARLQSALQTIIQTF